MSESQGRIVAFTPGGKVVKHGGAGTAYSNYGCRCEECRAANTARVERRRKQRDARAGEFEHGVSGYVNWNCRCEVCSAAHRDHLRRARESRLARPNEVPHGTESGWASWGCRCDDCTDAAARRRRARYLLKKAAAKREAS